MSYYQEIFKTKMAWFDMFANTRGEKCYVIVDVENGRYKFKNNYIEIGIPIQLNINYKDYHKDSIFYINEYLNSNRLIFLANVNCHGIMLIEEYDYLSIAKDVINSDCIDNLVKLLVKFNRNGKNIDNLILRCLRHFGDTNESTTFKSLLVKNLPHDNNFLELLFARSSLDMMFECKNFKNLNEEQFKFSLLNVKYIKDLRNLLYYNDLWVKSNNTLVLIAFNNSLQRHLYTYDVGMKLEDSYVLDILNQCEFLKKSYLSIMSRFVSESVIREEWLKCFPKEAALLNEVKNV